MQLIEGNGPAPGIARLADEVSKIVSLAAQTAVLSAAKESQNRVDHVYVAAVAVIGVTHVLASLLGHHGDQSRDEVKPEDVPSLINPVSTLVAALMANAMCPQADGMEEVKGGGAVALGTTISFGPDKLWEAVQQVERLTGRPVDGHLNPRMLKHIRKIAAEGDEPMNRFLAQRRATPGSLH